MTKETAKEAAKLALLRGRLRRAVGGVLVPLGLGAFALAFEVDVVSVLAFVTLASSFVVFAHLRGNRSGDSSLAGSLVGVVPFGSGVVAPNLGHLCAAEYCYEFCLALCAFGGASAGFLLGRYARRSALGLEAALAALLLATAGGALGCGCVGLAGVGAMLLGLIPGFVSGSRGGLRRTTSAV